MAAVEQMKKIVPLITCEVPFCQYVCELVFGVDMLDLDFGIQIDSVKQPIKSNSVGSGYMSHCWTSAFKDVQHRTKSRKLRVRWHTVNIVQRSKLSCPDLHCCAVFPKIHMCDECKKSNEPSVRHKLWSIW